MTRHNPVKKRTHFSAPESLAQAMLTAIFDAVGEEVARKGDCSAFKRDIRSARTKLYTLLICRNVAHTAVAQTCKAIWNQLVSGSGQICILQLLITETNYLLLQLHSLGNNNEWFNCCCLKNLCAKAISITWFIEWKRSSRMDESTGTVFLNLFSTTPPWKL